jgi:hypothetical protein
MKAKVTVGLLGLAMLVGPRPARSQIFGGCGTTPLNPCFSVDSNEITQTIAVLQQAVVQYQLLKQAVDTLANLPNEYKQTLLSQWGLLNPAHFCPSCAVWANAANTGTPVMDLTYGGAVTGLLDVTPLAALLPPDGQARLQALLANSIYLRQAAVNNDLVALGNARVNDPQMVAYVQQCQSDVLNAGYWSLVQVGQSSAACNAVQQQQQDLANNMMGRLVDHASMDYAHRMDQEIKALNSRVAKAVLYDSVGDQTGGIDQVLANWGHN